jgi:hypothetical protein
MREGRPGTAPATGPRFLSELKIGSRQEAIDFRQRRGELELIGAGCAGGFEVGAGPVAGPRGARGPEDLNALGAFLHRR